MNGPEPDATTTPAIDGSPKSTRRRRQTKAEAATMYADRAHWHVFPVWNVVDGRCQCGKPGCKDPGKHPHGRLIGDWPKGEGGIKQATDDLDRVRRWWHKDPEANVGIRTGRESGIIVLDVDSEAAMADLRRRGLPPTLVASTGRPEGGRHVYLAYPADLRLDRIASPNEFLPEVDLRADDSSVVAPPSVHHSGRTREWVEFGPPGQGIGPCPEWLKDEIRSRVKATPPTESDEPKRPSGLAIDPSANPPWLLELVASDEEFRTVWLGRRKDLPSLSEHRLSLADRLARTRGSDQDVLDGLVAFDRQHGRPPEPVATYAKEIEKARAAAAGPKRVKRRTNDGPAATLLALFQDMVLGFGHDQDGVPHVRIRTGDAEVILPLEGMEIRARLTALYRRATDDAVAPQVVGNVLASFMQDCLEGEEFAACTRIARHDDAIYLDSELSGGRCTVVRDGRIGLEPLPPGLSFRRPGHMKPYGPIDPSVDPSEAWRFLDLVNAPEDEGSRRLLLVWLVTGFLPHPAHPLLVVTGPQGSTKSTMCRYLRRIVDPSDYGPLAPPSKEDDLTVHFRENYMVVYDNVSSLGKLADRLCRAVTGETDVRRRFYTDAEPMVFKYRRLVAVNGIDIPISQPDLLDRCLTISLPAVPAGQRKLEMDADEAFEAARPRIVGACLRIAADVMAAPLRRPVDLPRLADWAAYGAMISERLGVPSEVFLQHYRDNASRNREHAIESNLFADAVVELVRSQAESPWLVRPLDLLALADRWASDHGLHRDRGPKWPNDAAWVTRRLRESEVDLRELGIEFEDRVSLPGRQKGLRFRYAPPDEL